MNPFIVGAGLQAGSSLLSGMFSGIGDYQDRQMNMEIARANYLMQNKQFDYQKDLQKQIFAREDNAVQRRAADMEAAGLSKTLAAGGGAGAGSVVSTSAPQINYKAERNPLHKIASAVEQAGQIQNMYMSLIKQKQDIAKSQQEVKLSQIKTAEEMYNLDFYKSRGLPTNQQLTWPLKFTESLGPVGKGTVKNITGAWEKWQPLKNAIAEKLMKVFSIENKVSGNKINMSDFQKWFDDRKGKEALEKIDKELYPDFKYKKLF